MTYDISDAAANISHNSFSEKFDKEKMKFTTLSVWSGERDDQSNFQIHRGLLIKKFLIQNSTKSESALKSALSRFK